MTNIFESPWPLVIAAICSLVTILLLHIVLPEKKRYRHLLIPVTIAITAFAIDYFVRTDNEKIHYTISKAAKAVESENVNILSTTIDINYEDSFHKNRDSLISHAQGILSQPIIESIYWSTISIDIKTETSSVSIHARVIIEPSFEAYSRIMLIKANVSLKKQKDNNWLIEKMEITEINKQPFRWNLIKY